MLIIIMRTNHLLTPGAFQWTWNFHTIMLKFEEIDVVETKRPQVTLSVWVGEFNNQVIGVLVSLPKELCFWITNLSGLPFEYLQYYLNKN
jgi:hypothetical protein